MAMAARADNALRMGNDEAARGLVRQARDVLAGRTGEPNFEASISLTEGWLFLRLANFPMAKASFLKSLTSPVANADSTNSPHLEALTGLVRLETNARNFEAALAAQTELEVISARTIGFGARELVELAIGRGEILATAGQYKNALIHTQAAIAHCGATLGPSDARCRRLVYDKSITLLRLGWVERVRSDLTTLHAILDDTSAPHAQSAVMLQLYRVYSMLGELAQQSALTEGLSAMIQSSEAVGSNSKRTLSALLYVAEDCLRTGRPIEAEEWLNRANAKEPARVGPGPVPEASITAHMLKGVSLLRQGRAHEALALLRQARIDRETALGPLHSLTLFSMLNEAQALRDLGRADDALALVQRAVPVLRRALGDDAPVYLRAAQIERELLDTVGSGFAGLKRMREVRTIEPVAHRQPDDFFN